MSYRFLTDKVAAVLEELELFGLILIGSFLAYQSLAEIYEAKEKYRYAIAYAGLISDKGDGDTNKIVTEIN